MLPSTEPSQIAPQAKIAPCHLLNLPVELQLTIYELALIENKPLLINCPCNSSYRRRGSIRKLEEQQWQDGTTTPPQQPALTRTCRSIRAHTLPIFYAQNIFRAGYCNGSVSKLQDAVRWLRTIGQENREMLRQFYFYDRNKHQDRRVRAGLQQLKECEVFGEMGGRLETFSGVDCCAHLVRFGGWERRGGEVLVAEEPGVPRLRIEGEV